MVRSILGVGAVILGLLAGLPDDAVAQNKKTKVEQGTAQDYYYMAQVKSFTGQLISFDDSTKTMTVRYTFSEWVPNPNYNAKAAGNQYAHLVQHQNQLTQHQNRLAAEMQHAAASKNPKQAAPHLRNAQHEMGQIAHIQNLIGMDMAKLTNVNPNNLPFKAKEHQKDFDLDMQAAVVYRKMFLPQEYDDTGNLKTYTKEKIAELKGKDPNPKGSYSAVASEYHPGQTVGVYLTPPPKKTSSSSSSSSSTEDNKDAKKSPAEDDGGTPKPTVRMLVIMQDGNLAAAPTVDKKKKN